MTTIEYRADIDGLRAIAVLGVVAFHAGLGCPGGFVGVDVFFVISGFLITSIIAAEGGRFSLTNFWSRRITRIWPAASVMVIFSLVFGALVLLPEDYYRMGVDALAHTAMLANIRFFNRLDYFAEATDLEPLLHLWSLAVEEQFYLLFPPLFVWARGQNNAAPVLALLATASFIAGMRGVELYPKAAFFLLPFRAWELLLGCLVATAQPSGPRGRLADVLGCAGLVLVGAAFWGFDVSARLPGWAALVPCGGAVGIIVAGVNRRGPVQAMLSWEPLRRIGLSSYSLYLWHWPLLAFARYWCGLKLSPPVCGAVLAVTFILTILSYFYVESAFRRRGRTARGKLSVAHAVGLSSVMAVLALAVVGARGVPQRYGRQVFEASGVEDFCKQWAFSESDLDSVTAAGSLVSIGAPLKGDPDASGGRPCFLLWGDSHGMALSPAFDRAARARGLSGEAMLVAAQIAMPEISIPKSDSTRQAYDPRKLRSTMIEWIRVRRPQHVILCCRWSAYLSSLATRSDDLLVAPLGWRRPSNDAIAKAAFDHGFDALIRTCESVDAQVWFLLEIPTQELTPSQRFNLARLSDPEGFIPGMATLNSHEVLRRIVVERVNSRQSTAFHVIDLAVPFFAADGTSVIGQRRRLWYADDDHLSPVGAIEGLGEVVDALFDRVASECEVDGT